MKQFSNQQKKNIRGVIMELTEGEKKILSIIFKIAYSQLEIFNNNSLEVINWRDGDDYNRNTIFALAEKLGIDI